LDVPCNFAEFKFFVISSVLLLLDGLIFLAQALCLGKLEAFQKQLFLLLLQTSYLKGLREGVSENSSQDNQDTTAVSHNQFNTLTWHFSDSGEKRRRVWARFWSCPRG